MTNKDRVYTVSVDFDVLADKLATYPAAKALPKHVLHLLMTVAAVSALHFMDEENENLTLATFQMNALAERTLLSLGLDKRARDAIYDSTNEVYGEIYTKAAADLELALETQKTQGTN
jgi:hypothetical protein